MLKFALEIATEAHKGQIDKGGQAYILHPIRVADSVILEVEKIVALLHDTIEDTNITLEQLVNQGFSKIIIDSVDVLTRRDNESYKDFIIRIKDNKIAKVVKLADLNDNLNLSRISNPTKEDFNRIKKYYIYTNSVEYTLNF